MDTECPPGRGKHQRRIAYISLAAAIGVVVLVLVAAAAGYGAALKDYSPMVITLVLGLLSLAGAFMGLSSWMGRR